MALTKARNAIIKGAPILLSDFGAVGDGITDDTVAVQLALNSGSTVVDGEGKTYGLSSTLTVASPADLVVNMAPELCQCSRNQQSSFNALRAWTVQPRR